MTKLSSSKKILLASLLVGVLVIGAVITVVAVLAASTQNVTSNVQITYNATEVGGTIEFSQMKKGEAFSTPKVATFDGSETTTTGSLNPDSDIALSSSQDYAVFRYKITGISDQGFYVSLEYKDMQEIDENTEISYTISSSEISNFENLTNTVPIGTITKNNKYNNGQTTYIYVKVKIGDLTKAMMYSGAYNLVLSREAWVDTNHDATTGIDYGYVENTDGTPYAAAVGYSGSANEITVNTTSVYGSAMPVEVIKDFAFSTQTAAAATSHAFSKVTIGNSVKTIEGYAFAYNTTLSEVSIGTAVLSIKTTAFEGCSGLAKISNNSEIEINSEDYGLSNSVQIIVPQPLEMKSQVWNGRTYYYVEMGEYPQTFAGYTSTTGTNWQPVSPAETITIDYRGTTVSSGYGSLTEKTVYTDGNGNRYIKHIVKAKDASYKFMGNGGATAAAAGEAWFKLEPIKWDVVGYYTDDNKTTFVKVTDNTFSSTHTENIVVKSRDALQGMAWGPGHELIDYPESQIYAWLRTFESEFLKGYEGYIETVNNTYYDANQSGWTEDNNYSGEMVNASTTVEEKAWLIEYDEASEIFASSTERLTSPSDFALATYANQSTSTSYTTITKPSGGTCYWWLRSSFCSFGSFCACYVNNSGNMSGNNVDIDSNAVVPAMLINL